MIGEDHQMKVVIIGAGASGVYLSILLKKKMKECDVVVLEQNASPLKKLLATGNGRCNLSHRHISVDCYDSDNQSIVKDIVSSFDMINEMKELGLMCHYQGDLVYPRSEQALSVKRVLINHANELGVQFIYEQEVLEVSSTYPYHIKTKDHVYNANYVVYAMGSEAGKLSGTHSSRYDILKKLGLKVIPSFPSLVQMETRPTFKQWKGVRVKGTFSLLENGKCIHTEKGELLFTEYGVSGIAVMQLSAFYQKGHQYEISIDFLDDMTHDELYQFILQQERMGYDHIYDGMIHSKIAHYIERLKDKRNENIVHLLKDLRLEVKGLRSYENAQVMKGGLTLKEIDSSLAIQKYPHMYAMGEILNVAGLCGGYNLHFAFGSAYRVAQSIERDFYAQNS